MKLALLLAPFIASAAFASTGAVTLDPQGPVTFTKADVDCATNKLTVTRRFRSERHDIKPDLCATVAASDVVFNQIGYDEGVVSLVGYELNGQQNVIVTTD